eukprot:GDKI01032653.1.p1 GENE.GDKI01032653.1~~GDKI01032653.1.p1  ORF type:complete len:114 (-),score=11.15 GDKI01032653.1:32-373(-)
MRIPTFIFVLSALQVMQTAAKTPPGPPKDCYGDTDCSTGLTCLGVTDDVFLQLTRASYVDNNGASSSSSSSSGSSGSSGTTTGDNSDSTDTPTDSTAGTNTNTNTKTHKHTHT